MRLVRLGDAQLLDVRARRDGLLDNRSHAFDELDVDAHAEHRRHDVREEHGRVDAVPPHGLQRDLRAQLRRPATSKNEWRSRIARYSGSERPAWRMNQTGVRSTGSRRAARTRSGSITRLH